jgi:hypothetical protein
VYFLFNQAPMAELPPNQRDKGFISEGVDATDGAAGKRKAALVDTESSKAARLASYAHRILEGQRRVSPAAKLERTAHGLPGAIGPAAEIMDQWYGSHNAPLWVPIQRPPPLTAVSNQYFSSTPPLSHIGRSFITHFDWEGELPEGSDTDVADSTHDYRWQDPEGLMHEVELQGHDPDIYNDYDYFEGVQHVLQHAESINVPIVYETGRFVRNTSEAFCTVQ